MILSSRFVTAMPLLFVWIWSTGFLAAKFGQPYAEPFTLLSMRFALAMLVLLILMWWFKAALWSSDTLTSPTAKISFTDIGHSLIVGILIHGIYLGGVFQAIKFGMPAGLSSMVIGLQPLVMALMAGLLLQERVSIRQWIGLTIGLLGLVMVLSESLSHDVSEWFVGFSFWAVVLVVVALLGIAVGSVYQKRFCYGVNLLTSIWWQYLAALVFALMVSGLFETGEVHWHWAFVASLSWQVLGLSIGAVLLLLAMIKMGESARVASLFYLVPPTVAIQAWFLFDEKLGVVALSGLIIISLGVAMARKF